MGFTGAPFHSTKKGTLVISVRIDRPTWPTGQGGSSRPEGRDLWNLGQKKLECRAHKFHLSDRYIALVFQNPPNTL